LGLGGTEVNPFSFQPFGGLADDVSIVDGNVAAPDVPGIGFEAREPTRRAFLSLYA
jgi:D(-)-tartrate dehydratase